MDQIICLSSQRLICDASLISSVVIPNIDAISIAHLKHTRHDSGIDLHLQLSESNKAHELGPRRLETVFHRPHAAGPLSAQHLNRAGSTAVVHGLGMDYGTLEYGIWNMEL